MVLSKGNETPDVFTSMDCIEKASCSYGKKDQKNSVSLHVLLNPGAYKITVFYFNFKEDAFLFELLQLQNY